MKKNFFKVFITSLLLVLCLIPCFKNNEITDVKANSVEILYSYDYDFTIDFSNFLSNTLSIRSNSELSGDFYFYIERLYLYMYDSSNSLLGVYNFDVSNKALLKISSDESAPCYYKRNLGMQGSFKYFYSIYFNDISVAKCKFNLNVDSSLAYKMVFSPSLGGYSYPYNLMIKDSSGNINNSSSNYRPSLDKFSMYEFFGVVLENKYNVIFKDYDNSVLQTSSIEENNFVTYNSNLPTRVGYTFVGWDYDLNLPITSDLIINAVYEINKYNVYFRCNGEIFKTVQVEYNSKVDVPSEVPNIKGYIFEGWDFDFDNTVITNDKYINAKLTNVIYNITVDAPEYVEIQRLNYTGEYPYIRSTVPSYSTLYFYFSVPIGYFNDKLVVTLNGENCQYNSFVSKDLNEYIYYLSVENVLSDLNFRVIPSINLYNVNFYAEDKETIIKSLTDVEYGTLLEEFNQTKEGYYFEGWFDLVDNKKFNYEPIKSDLDLYCLFSKIHKVELINYNNKLIVSLDVINGRKIDYTEIPIREDYNFVGWFLNDNQVYFNNLIVNSDLKIYARFSLKQFYVTFYYDNNNSQTKLVDINSLLVEPLFSSDKVFMHWIECDFDNPSNIINTTGNLPEFVKKNLYFKAKFNNTETNNIVVEDVDLYDSLKMDLWEPLDREDDAVSGNWLQNILYNMFMLIPKLLINGFLWFILKSPLISDFINLVTGGYLKVFVYNLSFISQLSNIVYIGSLFTSLIILFFGVKFILK